MKAIRRSPVTRVLAWLLSVALIAPGLLLGSLAAHAQATTSQVLRVIVADFTDTATNTTDTLGKTATAAVYNELTNSGQGRFFVFATEDVRKSAQSLGLRVPSAPDEPANYSHTDLLRIAKDLNADGIVEGVVSASPLSRNRGSARVALEATIRDPSSDQLINGGVATATAVPRPGQNSDPEDLLNKAVSDAALTVVGQIVSRQLVTATILGITNNATVTLDRGLRDNIKDGDDMIVLREGPNGVKTLEGYVHVIHAYATDADATITKNIGGITPEDTARVIFHPNVVPGPGGITRTTEHGSHFNFSAIGATLGALAIGVLVATAARGGQASVTGVTAQSFSNGVTPGVLISWGNNIFGQAGVLQYKIYRNPDFPFSSNGGGGTGTGGTTTTTNNGGTPIGTAPATVPQYSDRPTPYFPYANGAGYLVSSGNNNNNNNNNGNTGTGNGTGNGNTTGSTCTTVTPAATVNTGFTPGQSYTYDVTAIINAQTSVLNGGSLTNCIESDPSRSGLATPINPVIILSPTNGQQSVAISAFQTQFTSRSGADLFQIEISTDRTFSNPNLIFRQQVMSSAPNQEGVTQTAGPFNLTTAAPLLAASNFSSFVAAGTSATAAQTPTLFIRIGARHDEDSPGPENAMGNSSDRTFRFVYTTPVSFMPAPVPPPPPSSRSLAARLLNSNLKSRAFTPLPLPGSSTTTTSHGTVRPHVLTAAEILNGVGRKRP